MACWFLGNCWFYILVIKCSFVGWNMCWCSNATVEKYVHCKYSLWVWALSRIILPQFDDALTMFIWVWFAISISWLFCGAPGIKHPFNCYSSAQAIHSFISKFEHFLVTSLLVFHVESKRFYIYSIAVMANLFGMAAASAYFVWQPMTKIKCLFLYIEVCI